VIRVLASNFSHSQRLLISQYRSVGQNGRNSSIDIGVLGGGQSWNRLPTSRPAAECPQRVTSDRQPLSSYSKSL
jgi:hypothetical protein